jgi:hypothetical protein
MHAWRTEVLQMPVSGDLYNILHKMPIAWFDWSFEHQIF